MNPRSTTYRYMTGIIALILAIGFMAIIPVGCIANNPDPVSGIKLYDDDYGEIIEDTQWLRGRIHIDDKAEINDSPEIAKAVTADGESTGA